LENDSNEGRTDNVALSHWEIKILKSITKEAKGEGKLLRTLGSTFQLLRN